MAKRILSEEDEYNIVKDYTENNMSLYSICGKYKIGKDKAKNILMKHKIQINNRGKQPLHEIYLVADWKIEKYPNIEGYHYVVYDKNNEFETCDIKNNSGILTSYIRKVYGTAETLYNRRLYYMRTGNYWWEQWLIVKLIENKKAKKCPYCNWTTNDIKNTSGGAFEQHLKKKHNITLDQYLKVYPEDGNYFSNFTDKKNRKDKLSIEGNYVICPICNEKFGRITESHLIYKHNITLNEFKTLYNQYNILSKTAAEQLKVAQKMGNLSVSKKRFVSSYERELQQFLTENNISFDANRQILEGKEIDILIENKKIGIEFDGLKWHTEFFGKKTHNYHLNKTLVCNRNGYQLIHIFEDEYVNHKDIVLSKIKHILHLNNDLPKIYGRKCSIKEIYSYEAKEFLNMYHIQGFYKSSIYIGAFYNNKLIAVMSFKNGNVRCNNIELTRYATDYHYVCPGVASKCLKYFIDNYHPNIVVSFADRRWTVDMNSNLYTKLDFKLDNIGKPDYSYYNENVDKHKRFHKMHFCKQKLIKKYSFNPNMTELEMTKELGYDRIWNCGLIKYVWKRN